MSNDLELSILRQNVIANFFEDAHSGKFGAAVREYLDAGGDPNLTEPSFGASILAKSVSEADVELVERLLALGADPNVTDDFYHSALHAAIMYEWRLVCYGGLRHVVITNRPWVPMYQKLIAAGADVNLSADGNTPLHLAARRGLTDVARFLVEAGADLHAKDDEGKTPFEAASDIREYLWEAMGRHTCSPDRSWFAIDYAFNSIGAFIDEIATVLAKSHPEQGIIASLVCLRLIGGQFPKHLSVTFCKEEVARTKELFYECYEMAKPSMPPKHLGAVLAAVEREFALFEERILK